jgi:hypothetical protein
MDYKNKYIKYKIKYLSLREQLGGNDMIVNLTKELLTGYSIEPSSLLIIKYKNDDKFNYLIYQKESSGDGINLIVNIDDVNLFELKISSRLKLDKKDLINLENHKVTLEKISVIKTRIEQEKANNIKEKEFYENQQHDMNELLSLKILLNKESDAISNKIVDVNKNIKVIQTKISKNKELKRQYTEQLTNYEKKKSRYFKQLTQQKALYSKEEHKYQTYTACLANKLNLPADSHNIMFLLRSKISGLINKINDLNNINLILDTITIYNIKNSDYPSKSLYVNVNSIEKGRIVRINKTDKKRALLNYIWKLPPYKDDE